MIKTIELNKNNICIDLRPLNKYEICELFDILENNGQKVSSANRLSFLKWAFESDINTHFEFVSDCWLGSDNDENKYVVTFDELKEILKEDESI